MTDLKLTVVEIREETPLIRSVTLASGGAEPLPGYCAGAHLTFEIPDVGTRKYSLVNTSAEPGATAKPMTYIVSVRKEEFGGGGSLYIHGLAVGDVLVSQPPKNNFPLKPGSSPGAAVALVGGGIGVTPLISMAAELKAKKRQFELVYAARSNDDFAFRSEIEALAGSGGRFHADDVAGRVFDLPGYFASLGADTQVYACGPKPMLKACMAAARALGWPRDRLSYELFFSVA